MARKPAPAERSTPTVRRAAVIGGNRIPFGKAGGAYASASNLDMLTATLTGLVARFALQGERIGDVAGGAVLKHSRGFRSEEHTSELQSRRHLVCRLLLETKKHCRVK